MPRDLLLFLLAVGVVLNVALFVGVLLHQLRSGRAQRAAPVDPGAPVASEAVDPLRMLIAGVRDDPDWVDTLRPPEPDPALLDADEPARLAAGPHTADPADLDGSDVVDGPGARRVRRFQMPHRDESSDRSERAIAAFLGSPIAPPPELRQPRRRNRARRPAGTPVEHTNLILTLGERPPDHRIVRAVSTALRTTLRETDELVELPGGRLRITLEADSRGGEAFLRRARTVVRPWLGVLGGQLDLRVERGRPTRQATGAS